MTTINVHDSRLLREWAKDQLGVPWTRQASLVTDPGNVDDLYDLLAASARSQAASVATGDYSDAWDSLGARAEALANLMATARAASQFRSDAPTAADLLVAEARRFDRI